MVLSEYIDFMPENLKKVVATPEGFKDWLRCASCNVHGSVTRLQRCSRCAHAVSQSTYYCGRKCQKADWKSHKSYCDSVAQGPDRASLRTMDFQNRKFLSYFYKWKRKHDTLVLWAVRQAFIANPSVDPRTRILHIEFAPHVVDKTTLEATIVPSLFQFRPITESAAKDEREFPGRYFYVELEAEGAVSSIRIEKTGPYIPSGPSGDIYNDLLAKPRPQWPWILWYVAMMDLKSIENVNLQLHLTAHLIDGIIEMEMVGAKWKSLIQSFSVPPLFENKQWEISRCEEWNRLLSAANPYRCSKA